MGPVAAAAGGHTMTTIIAGSRPGPRNRAGAIPRRLAFALLGFGAGLRRRWRAYRQAELLRHLDERTLRDMGMAPVAKPQASLFGAPARAVGTVLKTIDDCARLQ